jgi:hypothetical protein
MINKTKILFWLSAFCILYLTNCTYDGECMQNTDIQATAKFYQPKYNSNTGKYEISTYSSIIKVFGVGNDSILSDTLLIKEIFLPLDPLKEITEFVFEIRDKTADTLTLFYNNEEYFLSLECGCLMFQTLKNVKFTTNQIDSILINDNRVNQNKVENIKIYFKAQ